jgi:hypothetical protein
MTTVTETPKTPEATGRWDEDRIRAKLTGLDAVLAELMERADAESSTAFEAVRALVDVYGEALARILDRADSALMETLVADELVSHLLLVHDLHPDDSATRIRRVLAELAPHVEAELAEYADGVATVVVDGAARTGTVPVEDAVRAVAPEVDEVRVERRSTPAFVPLTAVRAR